MLEITRNYYESRTYNVPLMDHLFDTLMKTSDEIDYRTLLSLLKTMVEIRYDRDEVLNYLCDIVINDNYGN